VDGGGTVIEYLRTGGRVAAGQPGDHVELGIDGDRYELSVVSGRSSVGRFAGSLGSDDADRLAELAGRVGSSTDGSSRPGAAAVTITVDGVTARFGQGSAPDEAWAALDAELERLAATLDDPVAAIGLAVAPDGSSLTLEHVGPDPCVVDLSSVVVHVVAWKGYYEPGGEWTGQFASSVEAAGPGWRVDLPFDHGLVLGGDVTLQVEVTFGLDGALAQAVHAPVIAPPN
jgi:hypothetical protein